jgi:NADH-quinone oxidoreductase subunit K
VFALFVLTIAAAEVGIVLAIVLLIYRNMHSANLDDVDVLKG